MTGTGDNGPRDAKGSVAPRRGKAGAPSGSVSPARLAAWRALVRLRGAGGHEHEPAERGERKSDTPASGCQPDCDLGSDERGDHEQRGDNDLLPAF